MAKYRKKPVVIEAFQMTEARGHDNSDWPNWLHEAWNKHPVAKGAMWRGDNCLEINTLEGTHRVTWGDWIIKGAAGELYPCKPDIFAATYEPED